MTRWASVVLMMVAVVWSMPAWAVTAVTCGSADVQAAITASLDGETVVIPAGDCTWTAGVILSGKSLTIQGAGEGVTILRDNIVSSGIGFLVTVAPGQSFRLTGLSMLPLAATTNANGFIKITGGSSGVRLDHLTVGGTAGWKSSNRLTFMFVDNVFGVVDHITWTGFANEFLDVEHTAYQGIGQYGDNSWAQPTGFGSANFFFVEDSSFTNLQTTAFTSVIEGNGGGGRVVVRHNTFVGLAVGGHGTESPQRKRGMRAREVYNNAFIANQAMERFVQIRSGTGLIHSNTLTLQGHSLNYLVKLWTVRLTDTAPPWGFCNGTGPYDRNDSTVYDSGVSGAGSGVNILVDPTKTWILNQWQVTDGMPYVVRDPAGRSSRILSNTAAPTNSLAVGGATIGSQTNTFVAGHTYEIRKPLVCIDQPGRGKDNGLMSGSTPSPVAFPGNALEPVYVWNNTQVTTSTCGALMICGGGAKNGVDFIKCADRACAPVGYTPYAYPHPLQGTVSPPPGLPAPTLLPVAP